eukprot:gnl/Chilomastix_caulleri/2134.p1 GENE.gnl/Chilomastix_caulleri/2134~~gnl/Chilomastix_caulleri/2134.p1  ORF type:complete len:206 (-),score=77.08 gnl/Chilomastix_caulleri/2134:40-657(-)
MDIVNPVQDQGSCGSCWAFGTVAGLETARVIAGRELVKLSEQYVVDCDSKNSGCDGGNLTWAERFLKETGTVLQEEYPYKGVQKKCPSAQTLKPAKENHAKAYGIITKGGEQAIAGAVTVHGALPVAINANPVQFYTGGILDPKNCSPKGLNHAVVIVGYGTENGVPFWKIRNSWGSTWGEEGYFRMKRGDNTCGVAEDATYIDA